MNAAAKPDQVKLPKVIDCEVTMVHNCVTLVSNGITLQHHLQAEAAEYVWQEVLRGGDRRVSRALLDCGVKVQEKAVTFRIGTLEVYRPLKPDHARFILGRQLEREAGQAAWGKQVRF